MLFHNLSSTERMFTLRNFYKSPALVDISITNRCNLACNFCYASAGCASSKDEVSKERLFRLFDELDEMNVHRVSLTGGEPLIREDFFDLLEYFCKKRFAKVLNTNGTLINVETAHKLSQFNLDRICVSLDGSNEENHERIRGKGTFKKTIIGIQNMQKYNLPVSTLFTLHNNNAHDLIETIKLNEMLGIEYMSVMVVCPTGRAAHNDVTLTPDVWYPIFDRLTTMKKNNEIKIHFKIVPPNESPVFWLYYFPLRFYNRLDDLKYWNQEFPLDGNRKISCQAGIRACSIAFNGDVYGCDLMMGIDEFRAGNIMHSQLSKIWNESETFEKLRNMELDHLEGKCSKCGMDWCGGGCRSSALNSSGCITGSDSSCFFEWGNDR